MTQFIAFLRAINVGGHTVKMDRLRQLFEEMGFSKVETFIASGNVIFETAVSTPHILEQQIETHLQQSLGYSVATFIRSVPQLAAIASYQPFPATDLQAEGNTLYIAFLAAPPSPETAQKLMAFRTPVDEFHIHEREVYWLCRKKMMESTFSGATLEKTLGLAATLRNVSTVKKLAAKYAKQETP